MIIVIKDFVKRVLRIYAVMTAFFSGIYLKTLSVFATGGALAETTIVKGSIKLANDLTTIFLILLPTIGILCIIYFQIRKTAADEQDLKTWDKRTGIALIAMVSGICVGAVVKVVINSYYGGNI